METLLNILAYIMWLAIAFIALIVFLAFTCIYGYKQTEKERSKSCK